MPPEDFDTPDSEKPKYRKLCSQQGMLPVHTGLASLTVRASYDLLDGICYFTVLTRKRPFNYGPGFLLKEERRIEGKTSVQDLTKTYYGEVWNRFQNREIPARDLYIDKCNTTGQDVGTFIERVCSGCCCWYCELSS